MLVLQARWKCGVWSPGLIVWVGVLEREESFSSQKLLMTVSTVLPELDYLRTLPYLIISLKLNWFSSYLKLITFYIFKMPFSLW